MDSACEGAGGAEGNRTPDLRSAIAALSHLSYGPSEVGKLGDGRRAVKGGVIILYRWWRDHSSQVNIPYRIGADWNFQMIKKTSNDRRFDDRHPGTGLVIRVEDADIEVLDISIGGMKFPLPAGRRTWKGEVLEFEMVSSHFPDMRKAKGKADIRAITPNWVAVQFVRPSYDLMKMVSRHVATLLWGDRPYGY